jgi:hypothetical protein
MANKCSLTCNVKDSKGRVKVSSLWSDLANFFKQDRKEAIAHYFLTKDTSFLMENSDILKFDADGEVTIASLKKALERGGEFSTLSDSKTLERLNEEIKTGRYEYSEALDNVLKFNKQNQFNEKFMATLERQDDGKYLVQVVKRDAENEYKLADHIQNKLLTDAIRLLLSQMKDPTTGRGLSIEFLDNPTYSMQYSTTNVHMDADGLMAIASILDGEKSSEDAAEAAGHFIVASMIDSPLIQRLINSLTPEVQNAIFKDVKSNLLRDDFIVSEYSAKEAAGILLGRHLLKPFVEAQKTMAAKAGHLIPKAVIWLLKKLGNIAKKLFGIYKPNNIKRLVENAQDAAATAAQGFISNPYSANVEDALDTNSTYTSKQTSKKLSDDVRNTVHEYYNTLGKLKDIIVKLRESVKRAEGPESKDILDKFKLLEKNLKADYSSQTSMEAFAENASLTGMIVALEGATEILDTDIRSLLDQIQPDDRVTAYKDPVRNARNLRTVNTSIKGIAELYLAMTKKLDALKNTSTKMQFQDADSNQVLESLNDAVKRLGDVLIGNDEVYVDTKGIEHHVNGIAKVLELKRRQVFIDALSNFYGSKFIELNAGKVWQQKGWKFKLTKSKNKRVEVQDLIDTLEEDISWFDRYLSSAADCGDFATAVGNKVTKNANMQADRIAFRFFDTIQKLKLMMEDAFGSSDCRVLYELIPAASAYVEGKTYNKGDIVKSRDGKFYKSLEEDNRSSLDIESAWEETSDVGKVKTGNLVSQVNLGAWEKERHDYARQLKREFNEFLADFKEKAYKAHKDEPGYVFSLSDQQRGVLYHVFTDPLWKKWHEEHSEEDESSGYKRMVPNHVKYHNSQWDELFDTKNPSLSAEEVAKREKMLKWYNTLMELKDEMDSLLGPGATVRWRAPQMTGRFAHWFRNLQAKMGSNRAALGGALRRKCQDLWVVRPEEAYLFGTDNEFNEIEEDPLENNMYFEKDKVNRLPVYGINKLKNMDDLSTDLFGTLMEYGSMAATYAAMEQVVDVFELGKDVLKQRELKWTRGDQAEGRNDEGSTKAYKRYIKFCEKQLYQINVTPPRLDRRGMLRKFANKISSLGGRILLWGNVHGGIVNTGTGMFEILKEAMAGENFTMANVRAAHQMYFSGILKTAGLSLANVQRPDDVNSLWIRHWNILSENRAFLHNQKFDTKAMSLLDNRLWEWFGHTMMLPYSSGDHYMQTIPYYAMGDAMRVYDHDGKSMRLMDAYDVVDGEEVYAIDDKNKTGEALGKTLKKLKLKDKIFRSVADIAKYDIVQSMLERIDRYHQNNPNVQSNTSLSLDFFSDEEQRYLKEEEFAVPQNAKQLETLKNALKLKSQELVFNSDDESAFMDKCRNICNRLHGIYNSEDKVTFQQNFYGNLAMSMRGYALGMVNRRYANSKFNVAQGKVVEGNYNTAFKVLASCLYDIHNMDNWNAVGEAMLLTIPVVSIYGLFSKRFGNKLKADMVKAGFSEHQYYNMRRTGADFLVIEALLLTKLLSSPGKHFGLNDDEDEEKSKANDTASNVLAGIIYYFANRWDREQEAFTTLRGMWQEGPSVLDYMPVGFSGSKAIWDIAELFVETQIDAIGGPDTDNSDLYYQTTKDGKYEKGDAKWKYKFKRLCPYIRSWYTFTHPYDAASGFEYGRMIRGK